MTITRKKLLIFGMLTILASAVLMACSSSAKSPRLAGHALILAFGDSLTFGTGATPAESYPAVLERLVGRRVVNSGVPGEVTGEGLSRLPGVLEREKPALLILCHGGNDLLRRLDRQQTADNLRAMIRLARERGVAVVLIAVPSPGLALSPPPFYRDIAAEMKIPIEEEALTDVLSDGALKSDYIHPNAAGYRRLAASIAALLKKGGAVE
ncbi:MAG: arylesterase [Syntrophus sp. GWC2_56_31]|nr:MAG: arylesterase [Syntrophus sp. GWC2_56_31]